jgi:hypothetical protein
VEEMKLPIGIAAVVLGALGVTAVGGFEAGKGATQRELALVRELQRQRVELDGIRESLGEHVQSPRQMSAACASPQAMGPATLQAALESALEKALVRRDEQARLEKEAQSQPSNENLEAFARGEQLLDEALKTKRWTDSSVALLRQVMNRVTGEQAHDLMQRLAVAINEDQVTVQTAGPPL